jgi:hypothetical protein
MEGRKVMDGEEEVQVRTSQAKPGRIKKRRRLKLKFPRTGLEGGRHRKKNRYPICDIASHLGSTVAVSTVSMSPARSEPRGPGLRGARGGHEASSGTYGARYSAGSPVFLYGLDLQGEGAT